MQDLDTVVKIEESSFPQAWSRQSFQSELERNRLAFYLTARLEDKVIAYGGIWVVMEEAHLTTLAVSQDYRLKGVASVLLQALIDEARKSGATRMTLEVRPSNLGALHLYSKFGFVVQGVRKKYYFDEDALMMVKDKLQIQSA